ncbi:MAG TPA: ABC transporter permease [Chloroflexota bacterium]
MTGFLAILRSVVRTSRRERTALVFTLLLPIFLMGLFGSIFGGSGPALRIGVVDEDRSALSARLVHVLETTPGLKVETGTQAHELDRLKHDNVVLLAVIPAGFHRAVTGGTRSRVAIAAYEDRNQLQSAALAEGALAQVVTGFAQRISGQQAGVVVQARGVDTTNVTTLDFYLPSMIAYIVLIAGIQTVAIALVDLRERGVLRRFLATPLTSLQILSGQIVGRATTVILQVVILIAVGLLVFGAHTHGSWALAGLTILVGIACFVSIGFLITGFARTSEAARGIASTISFPMMFLSGIFVPLSQLPPGLQNAVQILPLTYLSDALHHVLNDGDGMSAIWGDLGLLAAWAALCFVVAMRRFRWE